MQVQKTRQYSKFKFYKGNREKIIPSHINKLAISMKTYGQLEPILVDGNNYIIDGQHRIKAAEKIKIPIAYIKSNIYNRSMIQEINGMNRKNWKPIDFIRNLSEQGNMHYTTLYSLIKTSGLSVNVVLAILNGKEASGTTTKQLKQGEFKISTKQVDRFSAVIEKLEHVLCLSPSLNRTRVIATLAKLLLEPSFDYVKFCYRIKGKKIPMPNRTEEIKEVLTKIAGE